MARVSKWRHNALVTAVMVAYVLLIVFEWPLVRSASEAPLRALLALVPALPIIAVIALSARYVMHDDELQQRLHLIALSIAVGVVSVLSVVGAFLVMAGIWRVGGDVLVWVFPALCACFGVARMVLVRRTTGGWTC